MKTPTVLLVILLATGFLIACGPGQQPAETEDRIETPLTEETTEPVLMPVDEVAQNAMEAIRDGDVDKLKSTVSRTLSYYIDEKYVQDQAKHLANWDGTIKEIRYKKDSRTGLPLAVVYYADTADEKIKVKYLDWLNGQWHAMGGTWAFREISKDKFYSYEEELSAVQ